MEEKYTKCCSDFEDCVGCPFAHTFILCKIANKKRFRPFSTILEQAYDELEREIILVTTGTDLGSKFENEIKSQLENETSENDNG